MKKLLAIILLIPSLGWGEPFFTYLTLECGQVTKFKNDKSNASNTEDYIFGIMSGYISAKNEESKELVGNYTSNDAIVEQLFLYCKNNPLHILHEAVIDTYEQVKKKENKN